jgi:dephospho-CoA kinase
MPTVAEITAMFYQLKPTASQTCAHNWIVHPDFQKRLRRLMKRRRLSKRERQLRAMRRARARNG